MTPTFLDKARFCVEIALCRNCLCRGSRPMTRQYHDNWLRIDLELIENHSPQCESDYNISLRPVGSEKVAIFPLFSKSLHQTRPLNASLILIHPIRSWPIISCNFSSPSRQYVVYAELHAI